MRVSAVLRAGSGILSAPRTCELLRRLAREAGAGSGSVTVLFCDDAEMAEINGGMRGRPESTDVLSFPAGEPFPGERRGHLGDIAVSAQTARRQARKAGRPAEHEVVILLAHGLLHLLGYDHATDGGEMMRLQRRICRRLLATGRRN